MQARLGQTVVPRAQRAGINPFRKNTPIAVGLARNVLGTSLATRLGSIVASSAPITNGPTPITRHVPK
jgi:hypothetical protein